MSAREVNPDDDLKLAASRYDEAAVVLSQRKEQLGSYLVDHFREVTENGAASVEEEPEYQAVKKAEVHLADCLRELGATARAWATRELATKRTNARLANEEMRVKREDKAF